MKTLVRSLSKISLFLFPVIGFANPYVIKQNSSDTFLKIEVLNNRGLHFEVTRKAPASDRIWTSPMVNQNPDLASSSMNGDEIKSENFIVQINRDNLCVSIKDLKQNWDFITTCPHNVDQVWKGLSLFTNDALDAYGLGAYYHYAGTSDGNWVGRVWDPGADSLGNALRGFQGGANSYAMFPVLYVQGTGLRNYLVMYDSVYKQMWNMQGNPWNVDSWGDEIRWYVMTADNVKSLRSNFMELTGKSPVPPKSAFGMWLSEFGFENWNEVHDEITSMHSNHFPVDGAALDLQWFGGDFYMGDVDRTGSRFGTLEFDQRNFPNPKESIRYMKENRGVELMAIEESYISQNLGEFRDLDRRGFMARNCSNMGTTILTANPWWGIGGMLDWTNPDAALYWHNTKRQKLYDLGINSHWTDLGEPEMYDPNSCYYGFHELNKHRHADIHNIYNFKWLEGIANGYKFNKNTRRPFMMSRSGTIGIQRFGAAVWSGDIAANMGAMTAHYQTQMHMAYSGIDYYGSDIGGFHRRPDTLDGDQNELYTQWFANAALFDFPVRGHTWNLANKLETSPSKIGDLNSNKHNLRLRYKLFPYYYSLAHEAAKKGSTIVTPLAMEFPADLKVRKIGNQKMVGPSLMAAMVARYGEKDRNVYLPKGVWIDYYSGKKISSSGEQFNFKVEENGIFRIPLLVREGSIIPMMKELADRSNISGLMFDGSYNHDLVIQVYPTERETAFTLIEDDGVSTSTAVAKTHITAEDFGNGIDLNIAATSGSFKGMPATRNYEIEVHVQNKVKSVELNGQAVKGFEQKGSMLKVDLGDLPQATVKLVKILF